MFLGRRVFEAANNVYFAGSSRYIIKKGRDAVPMYDQLVIGGVGSYDDFDASVARRETPPPVKKIIKETIPFSNVTYDFSALNGEVYWEERDLIYVFEIIADTPQELEEKKAAFANWVMNIADADIFDPFIDGYHFHGTFDGMDFDDEDSVDKSTITVTFKAYPYKIADSEKAYPFNLGVGGAFTLAVVNNSSHRVQMVVTTDGGITMTHDGATYGISAGVTRDAKLMLSPGVNEIVFLNSGTNAVEGTVSFREEVF